jgi:2',3'-cyclic-nucleotide 2'-phosphodiesterase (5'-nucleotidase family)
MGLRLLQYADLETAYDDPERIGRLAGLIEERRDSGTVVCGAGDNTGPGVLSVVTQGQQALDFFRRVKPAVDTFGNHDFDHGLDALFRIVEESPQTWVCANAVRDGTQFATAHGAVPWTVLERDGHRVGIVGVAHPETAEINPNAAGVEFTDPRPAVERGVDALRDDGVDYIVVVSHLGDDTEIARTVDVDVILGGHDHEKLVTRVDGTLVCRPGGSGRYLLAVSLEDGDTTHHVVSDGPLDATMAKRLRERMETAGLSDVVGTVDRPIICDLMACKRAESRLGNLVTDAYRWKTDADVALNSGGGFRRRPPISGEVTAFDLVSITPFDADLVVLDVDGKRLCDTLEHLSLDHAPDDLPDWQFGHVSGARLVWDDEDTELREVRVGGEPIESDESYELATTEFFVAHDELFPAFGPADVVDQYGRQYGAVVEYVRETGLDPELDGRIRRPTLDTASIPERDWPFSP